MREQVAENPFFRNLLSVARSNPGLQDYCLRESAKQRFEFKPPLISFSQINFREADYEIN